MHPDSIALVVVMKRQEEAQDFTLQKDPCSDLPRESCNFGALRCLYVYITHSLHLFFSGLAPALPCWHRQEGRQKMRSIARSAAGAALMQLHKELFAPDAVVNRIKNTHVTPCSELLIEL